ncbi:MAG: hypothetical protein U9Q80_10650, partial [Bacillota bacterium]|nr:hypothetical protein [Bacillota bacterium]
MRYFAYFNALRFYRFKSGIVEFAKQLEELDVEIYSTGGTFKAIESEG